MRLLSHEYDAHAAFADLLQELVWPDDGTRAFRKAWKQCGAGPRMFQSRGGRIQEATGLSVYLKKASHLLRQVGIPTASFGDVAFPLLNWQLANGVKK
jgi:hypothetical protein